MPVRDENYENHANYEHCDRGSTRCVILSANHASANHSSANHSNRESFFRESRIRSCGNRVVCCVAQRYVSLIHTKQKSDSVKSRVDVTSIIVNAVFILEYCPRIFIAQEVYHLR